MINQFFNGEFLASMLEYNYVNYVQIWRRFL